MNKKGTFISISLPGILKEKVEDRLAESDFGNASEYICTLIRADLKRHAREKIEAQLLAGLNSGEPEEVTDEYLGALDREVAEIIARKHSETA